MADAEQNREDACLAPVDSRKIVVVGPCAAGKTTLVAALQARGYDARVSGQEHSAIPNLWQHSHPDVLISLDVDIAAVRDRRGGQWPEWLHDLQVQRLDAASRAADLAVDTTRLPAQAVVDLVIAYLEEQKSG